MAKKELKTFADAVASINAANKKWNILAFGDPSKNLRRLPMYHLPIDLTTLGGLPYGQLITVSGVEHSGKSSFAAAMMARYQKENPGKVCIWIDAENTLLTQGQYFHTDYGLSYDEGCFLRYDTTGKAAEEIFQDIVLLQGFQEIGMIVLDSSKALISMADLDNEFIKDNGQRASTAKSMGKFVKMMLQYLPKQNNILLVINQVTIEKDMFSTTYTESGGYSLKYFPSLKFRFATRTFLQGTKAEELSASKAQDEKHVDSVDGMRFHYVVVKNRLNRMMNAGGFISVRFGKGIDRVGDFLDVADTAGVIGHPSAKLINFFNPNTGEVYVDEETGKELTFMPSKAAEYLEAHPDFFESYYMEVLNYLCNAKKSLDLIDEDIVKEMEAQEAAIMKDIPTEAAALAADGVDVDE